MAVKLEGLDDGWWRRYAVLLDGCKVGMVVEHHDFTGARWGPRRWIAGHLPAERPVCWRSELCRTRQGALDALAEHLEHHP